MKDCQCLWTIYALHNRGRIQTEFNEVLFFIYLPELPLWLIFDRNLALSEKKLPHWFQTSILRWANSHLKCLFPLTMKLSCRNLPSYLELVYRKKCQHFKYILPLVEDWLSIKDEIRFPQMPEDWNTRKKTPKYWLIMSFAFFPAFSAYKVPAMVR